MSNKSVPVDVSFIIVNWNTRELLGKCLRSILNEVTGTDCEIIVVDNASSDGSAQMVKENFPQVVLLENTKNVGFAKAANQAINVCKGEYLFLLNSDTEILSNTVALMLEFTRAHSEAGIVGCLQKRPDGTTILSHYENPTLWHEFKRNFFIELFLNKLKKLFKMGTKFAVQEVDWLMGSALLIRREVFERVGLFDEHVFMYYEDFDLCFRAYEEGWKVYFLPSAEIIHHENASATNLFGYKRLGAVTNALFYFYKKHYGRIKLGALKIFCFFGALLRVAVLAIINLIFIGRLSWAKREFKEHLYVLAVCLRF